MEVDFSCSPLGAVCECGGEGGRAPAGGCAGAAVAGGGAEAIVFAAGVSILIACVLQEKGCTSTRRSYLWRTARGKEVCRS
jgi:hypothetical protein